MPTLLAITPHPDDESYSFAGTIALAAKAGWRCLVECVTFGEGGERHDGGDPEPGMLALARARELDASCKLLGAGPPDYWGWPDGGLESRKDGVRRTRSAMRRAGADVVLTLGADGVYGHPDHLAVHRWVVDGVEALEEKPLVLLAAFRKGLFVPQYEKCVASGVMGDPPLLTPDEVGTDDGTLHVDISSVRDLKLAAIACHRTQLPGGDPRALFPAGIVDALLEQESFTVALGSQDEAEVFARRIGGAA